jgi:phosphopantetheinyl transferase (holo-ACP synthase)
MIGNDIVDLALAQIESNWKRTGFLDKIFTPKEQLLILNAENSEIMIWNLWSRKEAVYKIVNRETGIRSYNPIQFECNYKNINLGFVSYKGKQYYTKTTILNEEIHTIAVTHKSYFEKIIPISSETEIIKKQGIPYRQDLISNQLFPVSISHHGRFKAYVSLTTL